MWQWHVSIRWTLYFCTAISLVENHNLKENKSSNDPIARELHLHRLMTHTFHLIIGLSPSDSIPWPAYAGHVPGAAGVPWPVPANPHPGMVNGNPSQAVPFPGPVPTGRIIGIIFFHKGRTIRYPGGVRKFGSGVNFFFLNRLGGEFFFSLRLWG